MKMKIFIEENAHFTQKNIYIKKDKSSSPSISHWLFGQNRKHITNYIYEIIGL